MAKDNSTDVSLMFNNVDVQMSAKRSVHQVELLIFCRQKNIKTFIHKTDQNKKMFLHFLGLKEVYNPKIKIQDTIFQIFYNNVLLKYLDASVLMTKTLINFLRSEIIL